MKHRILLTVDILVILAALVLGGIVLFSPPKPMPEENLTLVRTPEQASAEDHPDFLSGEGIPPAPEGKNIALGKKASSNGNTVPYVPARAVDGKTEGGFYWEGKKDAYPNELTIDLEETTAVHAVRVLLCPDAVWGARSQEIAVSVSEDGETFEEIVPAEVYDFAPRTGNLVDIPLPADTQARYVRVAFLANTGGSSGQAAEIEIYQH